MRPVVLGSMLFLTACGGQLTGDLRDSDGGDVDLSVVDSGDVDGSIRDAARADADVLADASLAEDGAVVVPMDAATPPRDASIDAAPPPVDAAAGVTRTYSISTARLMNPERGFYRYDNVETDRDFRNVREGGDTLVYSYVRLDAYRTSAIPSAFLDKITAGLAAARTAGIKVVLRFAYNEGPYPDSEPDAPLAQVLEHIEQVEPMLRANEDVIALVQAGFIGAWGEWHTSTNDLHSNATARRTIVEALLDAIPESRSTQLRYPPHKQTMFGAALTATDAWANTYEARTGHHNDCFLSSNTDVGTYPSGTVATWLTYVADDTVYVPIGGETCAVFPSRSSCTNAPAEMERLHYSFINRDYNTDVVDSWSTGGCMDEIENGLGYRFVMLDATFAERVSRGSSLPVTVRLRNDGWAAPFNPRTPYLVMVNGSTVVEVPLTGQDARRWLAGETVTLNQTIAVSGSLPTGTYRVSLWLRDNAETLKARPEYSIQTANVGTWNATKGWNDLGDVIVE
jgi:hypothetical protein